MVEEEDNENKEKFERAREKKKRILGSVKDRVSLVNNFLHSLNQLGS